MSTMGEGEWWTCPECGSLVEDSIYGRNTHHRWHEEIKTLWNYAFTAFTRTDHPL